MITHGGLGAILSRVIDDAAFAARCSAMAKVWEAQRVSSQAAAFEVIERVLLTRWAGRAASHA